MKKTITLLAGVALAATLQASPAEADYSLRVSQQLRPCPEEDSLNCTWDAVALGNGTGQSFTIDKDGKRTYIDHCTAHHRLATWLDDREYSVVGSRDGGPVFMNLDRKRQVIAFNQDNSRTICL